MKPVLEVMSPQLFVVHAPTRFFVPAKETPKDRATADHAFDWDETQDLYVEHELNEVEAEGCRLIDHCCGRSQYRRAAFDRGIQRGGVYERLERGAGLTLGCHMVQLARSIIASPNQRFDLARVRSSAIKATCGWPGGIGS